VVVVVAEINGVLPPVIRLLLAILMPAPRLRQLDLGAAAPVRIDEPVEAAVRQEKMFRACVSSICHDIVVVYIGFPRAAS
jgi:hypothetical protein